ncbi:MAG TPA: glycosyltransferase family 39 protein [Candidatus Saccharimonadales bacterium]|nr:glycosyltransferase family 39 protein [Candidatus Saccharimonadales bacterium]
MGARNWPKIISITGAVILLSWLLGWQLYLARADSQTTDEAVHISAGYSYLTTNDYRFNPEHPPLVKKLAALPLLFITINKPADGDSLWNKAGNFFYDSWRENRSYGEELMYQSGNDASLILFLSRIGPIILTVVLGLAIYGLSVYFWGYWGGLLSLGLYVFDPLINGHGHLVTTDIGASLGLLITLASSWFFLKNSHWSRAVWFGLALGVAMLMKFTLIIALPTLFILYVWHLYQNRSRFGAVFLGTIGKLVVAAIIAWLVIWAGYGFNTSLAPKVSSFSQSIACSYGCTNPYSTGISSLADKGYNILRLVLVPKDFYKGLALVLTHTSNGNGSFLLGHTSQTGWWYYFPILFFTKTPIPTLLLFALAITWLARGKIDRSKGGFLAVGAAVWMIFAMDSKADLGLRHILPIYPLLFILAGGLLANETTKAVRNVAWILAALLLVEFVRIQPFDMGYYNQFVGGSYHGYKIATDSNLDWGQDVFRIRDFIESHNLTNVTVDYGWDGQSALNYYGIQTRSKADFLADKSGYLIINASALPNSENDFLENLKPAYRISPAVFVYSFN